MDTDRIQVHHGFVVDVFVARGFQQALPCPIFIAIQTQQITLTNGSSPKLSHLVANQESCHNLKFQNHNFHAMHILGGQENILYLS
jgi:hypothetical protein